MIVRVDGSEGWGIRRQRGSWQQWWCDERMQWLQLEGKGASTMTTRVRDGFIRDATRDERQRTLTLTFGMRISSWIEVCQRNSTRDGERGGRGAKVRSRKVDGFAPMIVNKRGLRPLTLESNNSSGRRMRRGTTKSRNLGVRDGML
jgi:hypothetical protein